MNGVCIKDDRNHRVLSNYLGGVKTIYECISLCRKIDPNGYHFAGIEYRTKCYCGDGPQEGFDSLYTWPDRCDSRCAGASWQNCGGSDAMNLWNVPPHPRFDLDGICTYDYPRDDRVLNGLAETGRDV